MGFVEHWREEKASAWLYRVLAASEPSQNARELFAHLAEAAEQQAATWEASMRAKGESAPTFEPGARERIVATLIRTLGGRRIQPVLAAVKVRGLSVYNSPAPHEGHVMPTSRDDFGSRHRSVGAGGALRASVFGVNDGLVSNASLIIGVAGAGVDARSILLSGIAGLLAGAFSMAAGEYVSVRSQRELFEHQISLEREELDEYPDQEAEEIALIYAARGLELGAARQLAKKLISDPERALDTLAREELGLNPDDLGSPWGAALSSVAAFALGAALPLAAFWFAPPAGAMAWSASTSAAALFLIGGSLSLFTGRSFLWSALRMTLIGAAAAGATWSIGRWLGVAVS